MRVSNTATQKSIVGPKGFKAAGLWCGIKKQNDDLAVIFSSEDSIASAAFTSNQVKAAPVQVSQANLRRSRGKIRAIVASSGCANACTGKKGLAVAQETARYAARLLNIEPSQVIVASTGVIGKLLDITKIKTGLPLAITALSEDGFAKAARAIMTTDTAPKIRAVNRRVGGKEIRILGMAKGAGMINPRLATMFAFLTTDAAISERLLRRAFRACVEKTFNAITIDGDTSTNDTVVILANGAAGNRKIVAEGRDYDVFEAGLHEVCEHLAKAIVKDGEGATKFIQINVRNARSKEAAKKIAKAIANSLLVKTALYGHDPNWGRIICAAGYSGARFSPNRSDLYINQVCVMRAGAAAAFDFNKVKGGLRKADIQIDLALNQGRQSVSVWTCDISHEYISSNSDYTS